MLKYLFYPQNLVMNEKRKVEQKIQDRMRKIKEIKHSTRFNKVSIITGWLKVSLKLPQGLTLC